MNKSTGVFNINRQNTFRSGSNRQVDKSLSTHKDYKIFFTAQGHFKNAVATLLKMAQIH